MRHLLCLALLSIVLNGTAQTEGNNVFGTDQILQVDVTFYNDGFWNELLTEYDGEQNYIPAGISITSLDGVAQFDSVGIRLKGNSSMNHPGDKKPFKVDFNRFISGQAYDLLKKLNFNNGFKDPTSRPGESLLRRVRGGGHSRAAGQFRPGHLQRGALGILHGRGANR